MGQGELLSERFEAHRARLRGVAYRMLGSASEAEDAVQDAWLRLSGVADIRSVENLAAWLTTVVSRICLDMLRARKTRAEWQLDPHVPIVRHADDIDPEQQVLRADSIGLALLIVLEALAPAERIAFVLHDMFAVSFEEIADIVGRSPEAARQLASRARRRVEEASMSAVTEIDGRRVANFDSRKESGQCSAEHRPATGLMSRAQKEESVGGRRPSWGRSPMYSQYARAAQSRRTSRW